LLRSAARLRPSPRLRLWLRSFLVLGLFSFLIGLIDDIQVRVFPLANLGVSAEILYQSCFLLVCSGVAFFTLRQPNWSRLRNITNLLVALPVAALADNVSIDFGTLRPYLLLVPREGYVWRQAVFGRTEGLSYVARWVNEQMVAPNLLNGYVIALAVGAAYVMLQIMWTSHGSRSQPGVRANGATFSENLPNRC
jgi:hypothetical protein